MEVTFLKSQAQKLKSPIKYRLKPAKTNVVETIPTCNFSFTTPSTSRMRKVKSLHMIKNGWQTKSKQSAERCFDVFNPCFFMV